jgi:hypothetical protein
VAFAVRQLTEASRDLIEADLVHRDLQISGRDELDDLRVSSRVSPSEPSSSTCVNVNSFVLIVNSAAPSPMRRAVGSRPAVTIATLGAGRRKR